MTQDLQKRIENMEKNSMFYWYPRIKDLDILQPRTEMYKFTEEEFKILQSEEGVSPTVYTNCLPLAEKIGFPLFMRTDNSSCKHFWEKTCYVENKESLKMHIFELLSNSAMQGWMSYVDHGLVFRQFLNLETKFTAFYGKFPVNKERRYFICDGKIQCHHPYWYPDAIEHPSIKNWKAVIDALNFETDAEIKRLSKYAELVASVFDGYWSVDFAITNKSNWYLIDMAIGDDSFHWLECPYCPEEQYLQYKERTRVKGQTNLQKGASLEGN